MTRDIANWAHEPRAVNAGARTFYRLPVLLFAVLATVPSSRPLAQVLSYPPGGRREIHSNGVIEGRVSKGADGEPIRGVLIVMRGNSVETPPKSIVRQALTGRDGGFRFTDLLNGNYNFSVSKAGYDVGRMEPSWIYLNGPEAHSEVNIQLRKRPAVVGRVVDGDGRAVPHAQVQLLRGRANEGRDFLQNTASTSTDDRGAFRIPVSQAGRYWIKVSHMETAFPRGSAPRSTGIVFYPNSPDLLAATAIHLDFDQPGTELEIALPWAPATSLSARIFSGVSGTRCVQCTWNIYRVEGPYEYNLANGNTSRAGINLRGIPPGQYRVYVTDSGTRGSRFAVARTIVPEGRPVELPIVTQPPSPLSGRVVLENPSQHTLELLRAAEYAVQADISPIGSSPFGTGSGQSKINLEFDDLEFTLGPLPPGVFRLAARTMAVGSYLAGISRQGRPLGSRVIEIEPGGAYGDIEIRVRFDPAEIRTRLGGIAAAGEPPESYRIELVPDPSSNPFGQYKSAQCTPQGDCFLGGLVPGKYRAAALPFHLTQQVSIESPDARDWLARWGKELVLGPGENAAVEIPKPPESALRSLLEPPRRE